MIGGQTAGSSAAPDPPRLLAPLPPREPQVGSGAKPSFSIVIAAYQAADSLAEAIESALRQTLPPLEVVVCDDGSTDDLAGAVAPYREEIVLVRQENRGVGAAKNAAARATSGDFIAVLDADDIYLPERLAVLAEAAVTRPDLDILTTDALVVEGGRRIRRAYDETWTFDVDDQRRAILERCFIIGHAAVRRPSFLAVGGFDETLRAVVDWDLWLRMILGGSRAGLITEPLSEYRVRLGSISANRAEVLRNGVLALTRAAARTDLDAAEQAAALGTLSDWRCQLALAEAQAALLQREPGVRRRLGRIVVGPGYSPASRLKAVLSALSPALAASLLRRRRRASWQGAAGVRIERRSGMPR
ncbi:MAG: glycosyltransferase [Gaiellaceae bacterium]